MLDLENNPDSSLSQEYLNNIINKYGLPPNVEVRLPCIREKVDYPDEGWMCFYVVPFILCLSFPISGTPRDLLIHYDLALAQFMPNTWRTLMALRILAEEISIDLSY